MLMIVVLLLFKLEEKNSLMRRLNGLPGGVLTETIPILI